MKTPRRGTVRSSNQGQCLGVVELFTRTVDVLTADLTTVEIDESILSVAELGRALEFAMTPELRPYLAAHTWLRQRLAEYLDCPLEDIELEIGAQGRLGIASPATDLALDLSYGDGIVALAVGFRTHVGINIEVVADTKVDTDMVQRVLTRPEANTVFSAPDMRSEFLKLWGRKKALARAMGRDPEDEPKTLSVMGLSPVKWDGFAVIDVKLGDGVVAAVAVPKGCSIALTALVDVDEKSAAQVAVAV